MRAEVGGRGGAQFTAWAHSPQLENICVIFLGGGGAHIVTEVSCSYRPGIGPREPVRTSPHTAADEATRCQHPCLESAPRSTSHPGPLRSLSAALYPRSLHPHPCPPAASGLPVLHVSESCGLRLPPPGFLWRDAPALQAVPGASSPVCSHRLFSLHDSLPTASYPQPYRVPSLVLFGDFPAHRVLCA